MKKTLFLLLSLVPLIFCGAHEEKDAYNQHQWHALVHPQSGCVAKLKMWIELYGDSTKPADEIPANRDFLVHGATIGNCIFEIGYIAKNDVQLKKQAHSYLNNEIKPLLESVKNEGCQEYLFKQIIKVEASLQNQVNH